MDINFTWNINTWCYEEIEIASGVKWSTCGYLGVKQTLTPGAYFLPLQVAAQAKCLELILRCPNQGRVTSTLVLDLKINL